MTRLSVILIAVILYLVLSNSAHAVHLRNNAVIEGNVITLGDIFHDLPANSDKVLGPAPRPGNDMVLNARTLSRIAVAMNLPWRPSSMAEQIVLQRAATVISKDRIEASLMRALRDTGLNGEYEVSFNGAQAQILLPHDYSPSFDITNLNIDPQTDRFEATISAPSANNALQTLNVSGTLHPIAHVPVLKHSMRSGMTIKASDIDYIPLRLSTLQHDILLDSSDLIGTTPRRMIVPGKPVRTTEIELPQIIRRGETITMVFKSGSLELTALGRALENGAKGDAIRVVNAASNRTVQAIVSAEKEVQVQSF
jgi:flagella basal body P-ring formation protein FlgA